MQRPIYKYSPQTNTLQSVGELPDKRTYFSACLTITRMMKNDEADAIKKLLDAFLEETDSEHLREKCEEGFRYLRQFNADGHRSLII